MPKTPTTVAMDPETGLPTLPSGYFWRIGGSNLVTGPNGTACYRSGASIWKTNDEPWSEWRWSVEDSHYLNMQKIPREYAVETVPLRGILPTAQPHGRRRKKEDITYQNSLIWRYRPLRDIHVFSRYEEESSDTPIINEDNLLAETTKTFLAWKQKEANRKILGDYPPRRSENKQ